MTTGVVRQPLEPQQKAWIRCEACEHLVELVKPCGLTTAVDRLESLDSE
ncbi:MAG: hypothetical protein JW940_14280 [Polyangiaceae bacterium]|nr:hypothetical protein [Polyangiaceae bacterium]